MRTRLTILSTFLAIHWLAAQTPASDSLVSTNAATLQILSDIDSARVLLDTTFAGVTPLTIHQVPPGMHRLKLLDRDVSNWLIAPIHDSVLVRAGETKTLRYTFGRSLTLTTLPSGAEVLEGDSVIGTTPFFLRVQDAPREVLLTLRKVGYETTQANVTDAVRNPLIIPLKKSWDSGTDLESELVSGGSGSSRKTGLYISGIVTVLAGGAAAYFKIKADEDNDQFLATQDPAFRSQTQRFDTLSAVSLVITQLGFGVFSYYLLSE
jgi:hypothetical protein